MVTVTGFDHAVPPLVERLTKTEGTVTDEVIGIEAISQTPCLAS